jgi:hypothetical protein
MCVNISVPVDMQTVPGVKGETGFLEANLASSKVGCGDVHGYEGPTFDLLGLYMACVYVLVDVLLRRCQCVQASASAACYIMRERRNMNVYFAEFMCAFFLFVLTVYIS